MGHIWSRMMPWQPRRPRRSTTGAGGPGGGEEAEEHEMQKFSSHTGAFFGTHFLMGGERYELTRPETFLFGENGDLDLLGPKPVQFPYTRNPITDPIRTLNALVNIRRDSVKFVRHFNEDSTETSPDLYRIEFQFDCDCPCYVQIHFSARELVIENRIEIVSKSPQLAASARFHFEIGAGQMFNGFIFDPALHNIDVMRYDGSLHFPIVIEIRTVGQPYEQVHTTLASIERSVERARNGVDMLVLKPLKQKLIVDGVVYLLQEIFGIENKDFCETDEENGSECIICMSDLRDTVILPCRHLCICNGCAETLKYKLNNCPICRSPFRALLQLKAMRAISTVSVTDQASAQSVSQTRYETLTLIEALNGPVSHVTTVGASGNVRRSLRISPRTGGGPGRLIESAMAGQSSRNSSCRRSTASSSARRQQELLTVESSTVINEVVDIELEERPVASSSGIASLPGTIEPMTSDLDGSNGIFIESDQNRLTTDTSSCSEDSSSSSYRTGDDEETETIRPEPEPPRQQSPTIFYRAADIQPPNYQPPPPPV